MNSIRQFFTLRSLATFRQSVNTNPLAADDDDKSSYNRILPQVQIHKHQEQRVWGFWKHGVSAENNKFNTLPSLKKVGISSSALSSSSSSSISSFGLPRVGQLHNETLKLGYLCKVCHKRSIKNISKQAYNSGVVIVSCPGCYTNHLIADNVGWFKNANSKNIEDVIASAEQTERITKIVVDEKGIIQ